MNAHARQNAFWAGLAALMMLYFGWVKTGEGISGNAFYDTSVDVFYWMLKIGGILMLIVSAMCGTGVRAGLLLDVVVSGICGSVMVFCGVYWGVNNGIDMYYLLYAVFGVMFLGSAKSCWVSYHASRPPPPDVGPVVAPPPEPVHPASIHPASLPDDTQAPPPEGYLAALAKEDDDPPRASFE